MYAICLSIRFFLCGFCKFIAAPAAFILLATSGALAQQESYKLHPVYIYNFIKYSQWPQGMPSADVVIGVLGNSSITNELAKMAQGKMVGNQKIAIKQFAHAKDLAGCHIVFVAKQSRESLSSILNQLSRQPTLVITEKEGMAKAGSCINFVFVDDKLKYQINESAVKKSSVKVSAEIIKLSVPY